jgi:predicted nucleotidyltransferase
MFVFHVQHFTQKIAFQKGIFVSNLQKNKLKKIAKKHNLKLIILFGSFACRKEHKHSDVDIGVLSNTETGLREQLSLIADLQKIFKNEIDLSVLNHANPLHLFEASKNPVLLYGDKNILFNFKLNAFHRYNDYAPFFEMEKKMNRVLIKQYAR